MLAYSIKPILELIPEAMPLVKQAALEEDYPLDNVDSCVASALAVKYHECVSHKPIDQSTIEKVAQAVDLYGVKEQVDKLSTQLVKSAEQALCAAYVKKEKTDLCIAKCASFRSETSGLFSVEETVRRASELYKQAQELGVEPGDEVSRYSGNAHLDKRAAIESLGARFYASQDATFVKIASAIGRLDTFELQPATVADICLTVAKLDKEAGLEAKGFNFYRDAVITKQAALSALTVSICNQDVPIEKLQALGRARIAQYLGEDIAVEFDKGPLKAKQVLETLPLDLQQVLMQLVKNA
jgi:hypothetical protein